jgi:hypothetical protein
VQAAVELLIGHRSWLYCEDFIGSFVEMYASPVGGRSMAFLDWQAAARALGSGRLACSHSQGQVLRVAASLAEGIPVDLREAVSGLDERNLALVADAVLHAGGCRVGLAAVADHQVRGVVSR